MNFKDWQDTIPEEITNDPLWGMKVFQHALFLGELAWFDSTKLSKWQTLKIPIPAASNGALRNFAPSGTGLLEYFIRALPGGTFGSGHSSHQQAGGYSGK